MAESKKSPRPKGPRPTGPSGKSGFGGGKPKGRPGGRTGGKPEEDWRSSPPKGAGKGPAKGPGKGPAKGPRKGPGGPRKEGDPRVSGGYGKPAREKKAPASPARVDDFDFDIDIDTTGVPPAAFPQPARPAKNAGGAGSRPPRARAEKSDRPEGKFDKSNKAERPGKFDRNGRPNRPERLDGPRTPRAPREEAAEPEDGKSVTAGRNPVRELLEAAPKRIDGIFVRKGQRDAKVQEIVALADENRIKVQFVDDLFLRRLYPGTHQGVVAVTAAVEYADLDTLIKSVAAAPLPVLLALDQVQDPGNLGAMARTAWALGAAGIIVPRHGGAYIGAGAMRASAGALHHLPVARVTNMSQALDACAEAGLSVLCADAEGEDLYKAAIDLPAVLVMGGEEKGVRHGVGKHCQTRLAIPLKRSFDSLNVAQAAAICLARLGQL
ncbi:MAG: 23S rRNA (guanosine(2251)-2'-O)-methyltransferase RlmB [Humidesulfovibrio sp.]|nr:23S rRNA (guanosine(2251)-2'-O)-methyltransferase RlmB [Humidesulfovibrio sp.]